MLPHKSSVVISLQECGAQTGTGVCPDLKRSVPVGVAKNRGLGEFLADRVDGFLLFVGEALTKRAFLQWLRGSIMIIEPENESNRGDERN